MKYLYEFLLCLFTFIFNAIVGCLSYSDDVAAVFEEEYIDYMKTGIESHLLKNISRQLAESHTKEITTVDLDYLSKSDRIFMCTSCRATVRVVIRMFREGGEFAGPESDDKIKKTIVDMCQRLLIYPLEICEGVVDFNFPIVKFIAQNTEADSRTVCGTFMRSTFCQVKDENYNWTLSIDPKGPAVEGPKSEIPPKGTNDLNILQITDIHYDPLYTVGSLADCDAPLCCQGYKNISEGTSKAAGYWGDYRNCDIPWHTIVDSLYQIKKNHPKIDYIYSTGDVVDHSVWMTSQEKNSEALKKVNQLFVDVFGDIPVYPLIGNHESHPLNVFAPPDVIQEDLSTKWLYDLLAELWSVWLPESTKETIRKGGYYTVSPKAGFRIIALNNNDCSNLNWWILYDGNYLSEQLKWLHDVLLEAEQNKEHVHILAHIPTGITVCWNVWSREFGRLVERFHKTISAIFNGHTHRDEMSLYYANGTIPINVAWNGGSLTTYNFKNPNYKMFQVEQTSYQVVEEDAWYFNLTEANMKPEESPKWKLEYRMTEEFGLKDLSPASVDELLTKFAENPSFFRKYRKIFLVQSDPMVDKECDDECLKEIMCTLARGDNTQTTRCEELKIKLQEELDKEIEETPVPAPGGDGEGGSGGEGGASSVFILKITTILSIYISLKLFI
ncbi:sphingomyelin phosphodiesterase-like isoform X2 [Eupeodes corollae]|uniref:sphingomyelin phosphodiesterase-like isoform X2 n=1 Tax=Eupeodes corollae TaxID=290404 RepID=UPI002491DCBE|nr:sphingomyelin phosphodiesterase-like isoform X2 [Eupeodes corollae]